ncbi:kinase-like protein [Rozella allomycis CSF55]|uniref:non-specific serine/threonine protein kinase n=1 Tax=Rozella allomycis (strain CSF55) TaxID=988480 RepID=A0A4P9YM79_ROZAC|nr:kinase-like protein [Rozella allomycis CSF55]
MEPGGIPDTNSGRQQKKDYHRKRKSFSSPTRLNKRLKEELVESVEDNFATKENQKLEFLKEEIEEFFDQQNALNEEAEIEKRRKERMEILKKHKQDNNEVEAVSDVQKIKSLNDDNGYDLLPSKEPIVPQVDDEDSDEDGDDMFSENFKIEENVKITADGREKTTLVENYDDHEGYYKTIMGEMMDERYLITSHLGRGVFSSVIKATDTKTKQNVAIKVLRNNETMYKAGLKELKFLKSLMEKDPTKTKFVVSFLGHFEHRNHLCLVFEHLSMNLREVLKTFGRNNGLHLNAVKVYAHQLFLALSLLKKCDIIHADIKPDNMLVNEQKNILKLADFGSAGNLVEVEITPYVVSRFYRAPEIILGLPYNYAIDVWSVGCTLYELYTGRILFTGSNNNQMLKQIMQTKGKFPLKMLKKGMYAHHHFDESDNFTFLSQEYDKIMQQEVTKRIKFYKPVCDIKGNLSQLDVFHDEKNRLLLFQFIDFLEKCLNLNPEKRISPEEALIHPFITM